MCTVSYLPTADGFILTSNRDETPLRDAIELGMKDSRHTRIHFPVDPRAGGSWFAVSEDGRLATLLNGAFQRYDPTHTFAHSRGLVLLDVFDYPSMQAFRQTYDFSKTAPFTLISYRKGDIEQLIWDGVHTQYLPLRPDIRHFWSSVTLYPDEVRQWRLELFENWYRLHTEFTQEQIMHFHRNGGRGDDQNDFVMNRENVVRTLSITSAKLGSNRMTLCHENLTVESPLIRKEFNVQNEHVASS